MADFCIALAHDEFRTLLHNVGLACADTRDGRPVYESIALSVTEGRLTAEATNGHILFRQFMDGTNEGRGTVLFRASDAQAWIRAVKPYSVPVTLRVSEDKIELVTVEGLTTFRPVEGSFPNTERLWVPAIEAKDSNDGEGIREIMLGTPLLAAVSKLRLGRRPKRSGRYSTISGPFLRFAFRSGMEPVYICSAIDHFDALLMPARPTYPR